MLYQVKFKSSLLDRGLFVNNVIVRFFHTAWPFRMRLARKLITEIIKNVLEHFNPHYTKIIYKGLGKDAITISLKMCWKYATLNKIVPSTL